MKKLFVFGLFILISALSISCGPKERYGARIKVDPDTEKFIPLNQEACYYLAYECLTQHQPLEARKLIDQMKNFPEPKEKVKILSEGSKTILALSYLEERNYNDAIGLMRQLQKVSALPPEKDPNSDKSYYDQILRIRSSSIQLRDSLPALEEYMSRKASKSLSQSDYLALKKKWRVELAYQKPRAIVRIVYPFPDSEDEKY